MWKPCFLYLFYFKQRNSVVYFEQFVKLFTSCCETVFNLCELKCLKRSLGKEMQLVLLIKSSEYSLRVLTDAISVTVVGNNKRVCNSSSSIRLLEILTRFD